MDNCQTVKSAATINSPGIIVGADKLKDLYYREHFYEMIGSGLDLMDNCDTVEKNGGMGVHQFFGEV
jgi:hypothetical protein